MIRIIFDEKGNILTRIQGNIPSIKKIDFIEINDNEIDFSEIEDCHIDTSSKKIIVDKYKEEQIIDNHIGHSKR